MSKRSLLWVILIPILSFSCSAERGDWKKAKSQHSVDAYEQYLSKYPEGKHAAEARENIEELFFKQIETTDNLISLYEDYLKRYPKGHLVYEVTLSAAAARSEEKYKKVENLLATVVDDKGGSSLVKGLKMTYDYDRLGYIWVGTSREISRPGFYFVFEKGEGLVTKTEERVVRFLEIRKIDIKKKDKSTKEWKEIHIYKWDGSSFLISRDPPPGVLIEKGSDGKINKETKLTRISIRYGAWYGWDGFGGLVEGENGQERRYSIDRRQVKSITFMESP